MDVRKHIHTSAVSVAVVAVAVAVIAVVVALGVVIIKRGTGHNVTVPNKNGATLVQTIQGNRPSFGIPLLCSPCAGVLFVGYGDGTIGPGEHRRVVGVLVYERTAGGDYIESGHSIEPPPGSFFGEGMYLACKGGILISSLVRSGVKHGGVELALYDVSKGPRFGTLRNVVPTNGRAIYNIQVENEEDVYLTVLGSWGGSSLHRLRITPTSVTELTKITAPCSPIFLGMGLSVREHTLYASAQDRDGCYFVVYERKCRTGAFSVLQRNNPPNLAVGNGVDPCYTDFGIPATLSECELMLYVSSPHLRVGVGGDDTGGIVCLYARSDVASRFTLLRWFSSVGMYTQPSRGNFGLYLTVLHGHLFATCTSGGSSTIGIFEPGLEGGTTVLKGTIPGGTGKIGPYNTHLRILGGFMLAFIGNIDHTGTGTPLPKINIYNVVV